MLLPREREIRGDVSVKDKQGATILTAHPVKPGEGATSLLNK